jgi:PEP-CTERM motif
MLQFKATNFAILAAVLSPVSASASVTFTYNGFVYAGYDQTGIFGVPNTSLTGDRFSLTYTSSGMQIIPSNGNSYEAVGPISAALTINGYTFTIPPQSSHFASIYNYLDQFAQFGVSENPAGGNGVNNVVLAEFFAVYPAAPSTLDQSFSYSFGPAEKYGASGGLFVDCSPCGLSTFASNYAFLQSSGLGAPEPSTWAMMLLGFAGLGYAGYGRARASHATHAA